MPMDSIPVWHHFEELFVSRGYKPWCYIGPRGFVHDPLVKEANRPTVSGAPGDPLGAPSVFSGLFQHQCHEINPWRIWKNPRLIYAYDKGNLLVIIKAVRFPEENSEVEILKSLNSDPLRSCPQNHTIPLLEHILSDTKWQFLVMPAWKMNGVYSFEAKDIDDYLNITFQILRVCSYRNIFHSQLIIARVWPSCTRMESPIAISPSIISCLHNKVERVIVNGELWRSTISRWNFPVVITDFKHAMRFDPNTASSSWVATNNSERRTYNSPEKVKAAKTGAAFQVLPADIYALGVSLKYILAREANNPDESGPSTSKSPPFPRVVLKGSVPHLDVMLNRMTDIDPTKRPTAEAALTQLKNIRKALPYHIRYNPPSFPRRQI